MRDFKLDEDLANIEQLMLMLAQHPGPVNDLMREHLEAARFYGTGRYAARVQFQPGACPATTPTSPGPGPPIPDRGSPSKAAAVVESKKRSGFKFPITGLTVRP